MKGVITEINRLGRRLQTVTIQAVFYTFVSIEHQDSHHNHSCGKLKMGTWS